MKKIISIDFDFFQNVNAETLKKCYPDGIDLPTEITLYTWGSKYAFYEKELLSIGMTEEFEKCIKFLKKQNPDSIIMVANSHKHCYDLIHEQIRNENEKFLLVNADMHHDFFNDNPKIDCGNWINFLFKEYPKMQWNWITNPVAKEVYGFKKELSELPTSFDIIENKDFDIIFLCRSDNWSPPHLDKYFSELCEVIKNHFYNVKIEKGIDIPRDYKPFAKMIKEKSRN